MQAYIDRQVIIDRDQKILGYELNFRHAMNAIHEQLEGDFVAGTQVIAGLLTQMGTEWLLGDNLVVISVAPAMLDSEFLELLPPSKVVLKITSMSVSLVARCQQLREKGFALAFNDIRPSVENKPILEMADYIYFNIQNQDMVILESIIKLLSRLDIKLIAKKVETPFSFHEARQVGFHYFQGYHFAHSERLATRNIDPAYGRMIDLLNLVRTNADTMAIEAVIKSDVILPARLFQYVNSAGFGVARPVYSIRQALAMMGYRQLYRWLSLLIVTAAGAAAPPALAQTALIRAHLMELLGEHRLAGNERDNLFIVGLFSLLDVILDVPMVRVLETLNPPDIISEALLHRDGVYGIWLSLVEACEGSDAECVIILAQKIGLTAEQVNAAHLNALIWVEELARENGG